MPNNEDATLKSALACISRETSKQVMFKAVPWGKIRVEVSNGQEENKKS